MVPSNYTGSHNICNSSLRGSYTLFWPPWSSGMNILHLHTYRHTYIHTYILIKINKSSKWYSAVPGRNQTEANAVKEKAEVWGESRLAGKRTQEDNSSREVQRPLVKDPGQNLIQSWKRVRQKRSTTQERRLRASEPEALNCDKNCDTEPKTTGSGHSQHNR